MAVTSIVSQTSTTSVDGQTVTVTTTYDNGMVTVAQQPAPGTPGANQQTLQQRAQAALATNATFLAIATPSNVQVIAQVQTLTKECSALIRLLLNQLDSAAGT